MSIVNNRVSAGGRPVENDPQYLTSRRTLPLPDRLVTVLEAAKARQAAERLALGSDIARGLIWCPTRSVILSAGGAVPVLAGCGEGGRSAAHQAARRPAHLRDFDAPARDSGGGDGGVDRPQGRQPDDAALRAPQDTALKAAGDTLNRVVTTS